MGENHEGEPWRQTSRSHRGATERERIADFVATERVRITEESHREKELSREREKRRNEEETNLSSVLSNAYTCPNSSLPKLRRGSNLIMCFSFF